MMNHLKIGSAQSAAPLLLSEVQKMVIPDVADSAGGNPAEGAAEDPAAVQHRKKTDERQ